MSAPTSASLLRQALVRHGSRTALVHGDAHWSYADLDRESDRVAGGLRRLGVGAGDRVALLLHNGAEYVISDLALAKLAAVRVPLHDLLSLRDVEHAFAHSGARALIAHRSLEGVVPAAARGRCVFANDVAGDPAEPDFASLAGSGRFAPAEADPGAPGLILYTGGTTGRPKGVVHCFGALGVNLLAHAIYGEITPDEHLLVVSPLPHSAGFHVQAALMQGARVTLHAQFDAGAVIRSIAGEAVTWTFLVPTMIYRLLDHPALVGADLGSLRTLVYGAAPIAPPRLAEGIARLGPVFLQLYGQSECPNFATTLSKADHLRPELRGSCGQAVPAVRVSVRDPAGSPVVQGDVGEVCLQSSYTLCGYHGDPEQSAAAFHPGRWLRTGDLGYLAASGHLFLVDRVKDMVISGGMNVYSAEVERAIAELPGVRQVAVVGVPHPDWGEAVTALVVRDGPEPERDAILAHCRARLSRYKVPKRIEFAASLPLTAYGKVDKKRLRAGLAPAGAG